MFVEMRLRQKVILIKQDMGNYNRLKSLDTLMIVALGLDVFGLGLELFGFTNNPATCGQGLKSMWFICIKPQLMQRKNRPRSALIAAVCG